MLTFLVSPFSLAGAGHISQLLLLDNHPMRSPGGQSLEIIPRLQMVVPFSASLLLLPGLKTLLVLKTMVGQLQNVYLEGI